MSPSMPITIASPASARSTSSAASSPSSSTSTSSSGVYVPVHRRTPSNTIAAPEPKRILPIYTPAELMGLAQSPLAKERAKAMAGALQGEAIALSRKQQRAREYRAKTQSNAGEIKEDIKLRDNTNTSTVVVVPATAQRRRPVGRAAERSSTSRRGGASKFIDAASWRVQASSLRQPVV